MSTPPPIDRPHLDSLLARRESETLEFKSTLDLRDRGDELGLAQDVAAFGHEGGHIVIGVDDRGTPTGDLTDAQARLLDEARLRPKLEKYLPAPLTIRVAEHSVDGHTVVVIHVQPHPDGFVIMDADGTNSENRVVFQRGDVYLRHGTSTERWRPSDIPRIKSRVLGVPELVPAPAREHQVGEPITVEGSPYALTTVSAFIELENVGNAIARILHAEVSVANQTMPSVESPSAIAPGTHRPLEVRLTVMRGAEWPGGAQLTIKVEYEGSGGRRRRMSAEMHYYKATGWHRQRWETEDL